jgi:hypothetical protein
MQRSLWLRRPIFPAWSSECSQRHSKMPRDDFPQRFRRGCSTARALVPPVRRLRDGASADVIRNVHCLGAGIGAPPPPKLWPSSEKLPVKVASSGPWNTEIFRVCPRPPTDTATAEGRCSHRPLREMSPTRGRSRSARDSRAAVPYSPWCRAARGRRPWQPPERRLASDNDLVRVREVTLRLPPIQAAKGRIGTREVLRLRTLCHHSSSLSTFCRIRWLHSGAVGTRLYIRPARSTPTTVLFSSRVKKPRCPFRPPSVMMYSSVSPGSKPIAAGA